MYKKRGLIPLVMREMQIKTTMRYHCTTIRIAKVEEKLTMPCTDRTQGNWNPNTLLMAVQHGTTTLENSLAVSYQAKHIFAI